MLVRRQEHLHFVGIGGIGMSALADICHQLGYRVTGSDASANAMVTRLRKAGVTIQQGHAPRYAEQADAVVFSSAIAADNPELCVADARGIPRLSRAALLAELMRFYEGIAVAGTHGKTTTTSLIASILLEAECDPTFVIGGVLRATQSNARLGQGRLFVTEADESDASLVHLSPLLAVVTNIDDDHMSTYAGDFERLKATFSAFIDRLPFYGHAILCLDDPVIAAWRSSLRRPQITYGFAANADVRAIDFAAVGLTTQMTVLRPDRQPLPIQLALPGRHNAQNALAAIAVATHLELPDGAIQRGLAAFGGVGRRSEVLGHWRHAAGTSLLIDDYGHHPAEVRATLQGLRAAYPHRRIVTVFQPHRYTRTRDLWQDFARSFGAADALILLDVHAAGEAPIAGIDSGTLAAEIRTQGGLNPQHAANVEELSALLQGISCHEDILLMQGAGSVSRLAHELLASTAPVANYAS